MIYTVGKREAYEQYLAESPEPMKLEGGSVWYTVEEARRFLAVVDPAGEYDVYAVDADWSQDTKLDIKADQQFLLRDARLYPLLDAVSYTHLTLPTNREV